MRTLLIVTAAGLLIGNAAGAALLASASRAPAAPAYDTKGLDALIRYTLRPTTGPKRLTPICEETRRDTCA